MAGTLVRLKVALVRGGFRAGGTAGVIAFAIAALVGVGLGGFAAIGLALLRGANTVDAADTAALAFGVLFLGWTLAPLITLASDNTLEPDRLAFFPLRATQMMPGLLLASMVGIGGLFTSLVLLGALVGLAPVGPGLVVCIVAVGLEGALCVTASKALATLLSSAVRTRRWRDVALTIGPVLILAINIGVQFWSRHRFGGAGARPHRPGVPTGSDLAGVRTVVRWFPPGWPARAMGAVRSGDLGFAIALLAGSALLVVALGWAWWRAIERLTTTAPAGGARSSAHRALQSSWMAFLPAGRIGAVAAKDLKYRWRDPRLRAVTFGVLLGGAAPLISTAAFGTSNPRIVLFVAFPALFLGVNQSNQFGFDGAAYWTNVVAGDDLGADLRGKALASLLAAVILLLPATVALAVTAQTAISVIPALGLAVAAFGIASGFAIVLSVTAPYPLPDRSSNVFSAGGPGSGTQNVGGAFVVLLAAGLVFSPLAFAAFVVPAHSGWQLAIAAIGCVAGAAAWRVGVRRATRHSQNRQAELLAALSPRRAG